MSSATLIQINLRPEIVRLFEPPYETNRTDMIDHVQNSHYRNGLLIRGKVGAFGAWRNQAGVMHFVGGYNGDGMDDIALVRFRPGWSSVSVAFSLGPCCNELNASNRGRLSIGGLTIVPIAAALTNSAEEQTQIRRPGEWAAILTRLFG